MSLSIMIVDDDEDDRYLLARDLKKVGLEAEIFEANDGEPALEFLSAFEANKSCYPETFPPQIIFLDINMPRVDGLSFLKAFAELRDEPELAKCRILMFSSSDREDDVEIAMGNEFVAGYLTKGNFTREQLREQVLAIVDRV